MTRIFDFGKWCWLTRAKKTWQRRWLVILVLLSSTGIAQISYDLHTPSARLVLPDTLREISDITDIDSNTVACIQDENGIIFIYDLPKNKIRKLVPFGPNGDYEGIARVGRNLFVLRSDGVLYEVADYNARRPRISVYHTTIPAGNNEGLCYDAPNNRLLVACKSKPAKGPEYKHLREIYAFDLASKALVGDPVFVFDVNQVITFAQNQGIILPIRVKKKGDVVEVLKFTASAIAVHPATHEYYLLSSADKLLIVFDRQGQVKQMESLDPLVFNKPEGIIFLAGGDLLISNEGQDKHPTLLRFTFKMR